MKLTNIQTTAIVALIIFGIVFYWFAYKPSEAKKECYGFARYHVSEGENYDSLQIQEYERLRFEQCLHNYGL